MNSPIAAIGVWDGLSAKVAEESGAQMLCASGFAISASLGFPDAELYSMTENLRAVESIREASDLPVIADIDTGYGNALNAARTARKFSSLGVDYVFMEDQQSPKECPVSTSADLPLVSTDHFVGKIRAIKDSVGDDLKLVARTDAYGEAALERAEAYAAAGADLIMPVSKTFQSLDEWRQCHARTGKPLVATLTPSTWIERDFTQSVMAELGVAIAILPTQGLMAATGAMMAVYSTLARSMDHRQDWGMSHGDFSDLIGFNEVHRSQEKYLPAEVTK